MGCDLLVQLFSDNFFKVRAWEIIEGLTLQMVNIFLFFLVPWGTAFTNIFSNGWPLACWSCDCCWGLGGGCEHEIYWGGCSTAHGCALLWGMTTGDQPAGPRDNGVTKTCWQLLDVETTDPVTRNPFTVKFWLTWTKLHDGFSRRACIFHTTTHLGSLVALTKINTHAAHVPPQSETIELYTESYHT